LLVVVALSFSFAVANDKNAGDSTQVNLPPVSEVLKTEVVEEEGNSPNSIESARTRLSEPSTDLWYRSTLTGNWNGARDDLIGKGVSFSFDYKADNISNLSGGQSQNSSYLHNIDMVIAVDAEALLHWKGASFLIHAIHNNGAGFSKYVGDAQVTCRS